MQAITAKVITSDIIIYFFFSIIIFPHNTNQLVLRPDMDSSIDPSNKIHLQLFFIYIVYLFTYVSPSNCSQMHNVS